MRLNRRLLAALLALCIALSLAMPAFAADIQASYGEAKFYDIAVTNYSRMLVFQNGVVPAADASMKYGLINAAGETVVPFQYDSMKTLDGGLFAVSVRPEGSRSEQTGIIDSTGKVILAPAEGTSIACANKTIQVSTRDTSSWTTTTNYYTLDMQPSTAEAFIGNNPLKTYSWYTESYGYYFCQKYDSAAEMTIYDVLDSSYQKVIPTQTDYISAVKTDSTILFLCGGKVFDASGAETSLSGRYDSVSSDYRGSAVLFVEKDGMLGAIDYAGNVLVPLGNYTTIHGMNQQGYLSAVSYQGSKWEPAEMTNITSTIFRDGAQVKTIPGKYVATEAYYRDMAFRLEGQSDNGMMDVNENVIIPASYEAINGDDNGNYRVVKSDYTNQILSYNGTALLGGGSYDLIRYMKDNKYRVNQNGAYGVRTLDGTDVIPVVYSDMRVHSMDFIELEDNSGNHSVVDLNNNVLIPASPMQIDVIMDNFIRLYEYGGESTIVDSRNNTIVPLSEDIQIFHSVANNNYDTYYSDSWKFIDGYDQTVLPYCYQLSNGTRGTIFADYAAGTVTATAPVWASNINADGMFVYQDANGLFGLASTSGTPTPAPTPKPVGDEYIYDTVEPGADLSLPAELLNSVTDSASAAKAVADLVVTMTNEQKASPTSVDLATLFAETAVAKAASKQVSGGDILINAAAVRELESIAAQTKTAVETMLTGGGVSTARILSGTVTLVTDSTSVQVRIDPDVLTTSVDKVRVETPNFALTFKLSDLAPDLTKILTFSASDRDAARLGGKSVGVVMPDGGTSSSITVSLPSDSGDTTYQAVTDSNGNASASKYNPATTKIDGKINTSGTYSVQSNVKDFTDIAGKSKEMQDAIRYLSSKGIINGATETTFNPDGSINRAEVATLLVRALGKLDNNASTTFSDVSKNDWFYASAASSQKHSLVNGFEDNTFRGNANIQKAQIVSMASRVLSSEMNYTTPTNSSSYLSKYSDTIATWAQPEVALATRENLIVYRTDGTFSGDNAMTRGDAAIIIYRLFQKIW